MITDQIARQLAHAIATKGQASLVVCGGSSPISIFAALTAGAHEGIVDWSHVTITLVDDRLVPADHQHSNQKLLHDHLLCGAVAAATFIPLAIDNAADNIGRPFDVMLLGMGVDGHFASLFPDMVGETSLQVDAPDDFETGPKGSPSLPRVSMNLAMILQSKLLILLVNGSEQAVLEAARTDPGLPVHALLKQDVTPLKSSRIDAEQTPQSGPSKPKEDEKTWPSQMTVFWRSKTGFARAVRTADAAILTICGDDRLPIPTGVRYHAPIWPTLPLALAQTRMMFWAPVQLKPMSASSPPIMTCCRPISLSRPIPRSSRQPHVKWALRPCCRRCACNV